MRIVDAIARLRARLRRPDDEVAALALDPVAFCRRLTLEGWDELLAAEEVAPPLLVAPMDGPWRVGLRTLALYRRASRLHLAAEVAVSADDRRRLEALFPDRVTVGEVVDAGSAAGDVGIALVPGDGDAPAELRPGAPRLRLMTRDAAGGWRVTIAPLAAPRTGAGDGVRVSAPSS